MRVFDFDLHAESRRWFRISDQLHNVDKRLSECAFAYAHACQLMLELKR